MRRNRTVSQAAEEYLAHCRARGLAPTTVKGRAVTLGQLERFVRDIQVHRIEGRHVDRFFSQEDWREATMNNKTAQLESFFRFCRARGFASRDHDPMFGHNRRSVPEVDRTRIPRAAWGSLLTACRTPQERLVIASGLYLFLRASEQQHLRIKHVHLDDYEVDVYRPKTKTWDRMPITSELAPYLRDHLEWYSARVYLEPEHFLLPGGTSPKQREANGRLIAGTGRTDPNKPFAKPHQVVQRVLSRAGYPTAQEGEHTLRRSGARAYFDYLVGSGYDGALRRVMSMLGHRDSKTTEIYLGLNLDRHARNDDLRGKPMFPLTDLKNVASLEEYRGQA